MSTKRIMIIGHGKSINEISTEGYRRGYQIDTLIDCATAWPILSQLRSAYAVVFVVNALEDADLLTLCLKKAVPLPARLVTIIAANYEDGDLGRFKSNPVIHSVLREPLHIKDISDIYNSYDAKLSEDCL